jgi:protein-S-isoprenylcysteine O-methyltransferase Ste14
VLGLSAVHIVDGCWAVLVLFWATSALFAKRTAYRQAIKDRLAYLAIFAAAFALLFEPYRWPYLSASLLPRAPAVLWLGAALCVLGLLFALWSRATLGRNWSGIPSVKSDHELIQHGPYALVRHPIYAALLTMFIGTEMVIGSAGGVIGFPLLLGAFRQKLELEESLMVRQFPEAYPAYMRRVAQLIPFARGYPGQADSSCR